MDDQIVPTNGANVYINENSGILHIGDHLNLTCCCGSGHYNNVAHQPLNLTSSRECAENPVMPAVVLSDSNEDVMPQSKLCLCEIYKQGEKLVFATHFSKFVTDLMHHKNCSHFEFQLKVKMRCKVCKGNLSKTAAYSSQEFDVVVTSPNISLNQDKPDDSFVQCQENFKEKAASLFLPILNDSKFCFKEEDYSFIRVVAKLCEDKKSVRVKLLFDVRRYVRRRCKSASDVDDLKQQDPSGVSTLHSNSSYDSKKAHRTRSNERLFKTRSTITVCDENVCVSARVNDKHDHNCSVYPSPVSLQMDKNFALSEDECCLENLEERGIFAIGQFGPLYKDSAGAREKLIKVVKTEKGTEDFLKEAEQFFKCRHPHIRPTVRILERSDRSYVFYWFFHGQSLFEAIEGRNIKNYKDYCRILYGVVCGLQYLDKIGIQCLFLSPEKVLLDRYFNPRICGVSLAYFDSSKYEAPSDGGLHRSLSYLDVHLRSRRLVNSKTVLWSVGRIIWDMLLGRISGESGDEEDLLLKYGIMVSLHETCDDRKIITNYFSPELRRLVYEAGWPRDREITKRLVVCAVRCMLVNLGERMSLGSLEAELSELQKKDDFGKYQLHANDCLYCQGCERGHLALTCGCTLACTDCLKSCKELYCPEHGTQFSEIGHPFTYAVIFQGSFDEDRKICDNDADKMEELFTDQDVFAIDKRNLHRVRPNNRNDAREALDKIKRKILSDKSRQGSHLFSTSLLFYIGSHCHDDGNLILPGKGDLKNQIHQFISNVNPKDLIVLANGYYTEKFVRKLSQIKTSHPFATARFFGVFSHAGNLCSMSKKDISEENSIMVKFISDVLQKDRPKACPAGYLTIGNLVSNVSRRMEEKLGKCLRPVERSHASCIPIAYV